MARRMEASLEHGVAMSGLTPETLPGIQQALRDADLDGWLFFEFRGLNPIALRMLGIEAVLSRRIFVLVPRDGVPMAITHNIEQHVWRDWPAGWGRKKYSAWPDLERLLKELVQGKRVAMEYSPGDAVPYLDRVPGGVLEMVRAAGATVSSSAELVSQFNATWTAEHQASHVRVAEHLAAIANDAFDWVASEVHAGRRVHEHEVQGRILGKFVNLGLTTYSPPNVSFGANAADPHYEPTIARPVTIEGSGALLIDLWAREPGMPYADQTWMAHLGAPSAKAQEIWRAIRDARDEAIAYLKVHIASGTPIRGADVDNVTRKVIVDRGFGPYFTHRTGHSMDSREIHGSGPNLDDLESRDVRLLIDRVAFSIEPGVYIPGEIGMRTEVNAFIDGRSVLVTPTNIQKELIVL